MNAKDKRAAKLTEEIDNAATKAYEQLTKAITNAQEPGGEAESRKNIEDIGQLLTIISRCAQRRDEL